MTGERMLEEMAAQPEVLRRLVGRRATVVEALRRRLPSPLRGIVLVARGSSDNAAIHGRYVLEAAARVPVALAAPSLHTRYGVVPALEGFLAIGVSQSGATPEIVTTLEVLARGGARTVAITNAADSPLAGLADLTVPLEAGEEIAVPATKTFTAQAAAFCLVAEAFGGQLATPTGWDRAIAAVEDALADPGPVEALAAQIEPDDVLLLVGRGYLYGAALEVGLKLSETTGMAVHGTSPADLLHGPIATVKERTRALCLASAGPVADDVREIAHDLAQRGARVAAIAADPALVPAAAPVIPVLPDVPESLAILPHVVRGQQLAHATATRLGVDPDQPFALRKVTPTT
jgi:glucosamine--fructose-6-phosphate aminotransferase (isomerizing)